MNNKNELFPIYYNGEKYYEKDCDDLFLSFYDGDYTLNSEGGVYLGEDIYIYPDGSME